MVDVGVDAAGGARHQAERGGDGLAVDAHFAVARDAREARLHGRGKLAGVAEEERPAARRREQTAGRGGLEIRRRDRALAEERGVEPFDAAVDDDERRGRRAPACVQLARNRLGIDAALGDNQDAAVERRRAPDEFLQAADDRGSTDELQCARRCPRETGRSCAGEGQGVCHGLDRY